MIKVLINFLKQNFDYYESINKLFKIQLLGIAMKLEKPELEQKTKELNKQNEAMKQQILIIEQELLKVYINKLLLQSAVQIQKFKK